MRAGDGDEDVLRVPQRVRRRAEHEHLPGVPRPAGLAAGAQRAGRRARRPASGSPCTATCVPSVFARKNYFYPDMPKDYQVTQYDRPINVAGWLDLPSGLRVGITRAHLEEDTGKSTHVGDERPDPRRRAQPHRLQPRRRAAARDRVRARHPHRRPGPRVRGGAARRSSLAVGRVRRQDGRGIDAGRRQRVGPARRRRRRSARGARSRTSTRCGRWVAPSSTRRAGRST